MERKEETLVLDGNTYVLRELELPETLEIVDRTVIVDSARGERRVLVGSEMLLTVFYSLASWSICEGDKPVKITEASVRKYLPKNHLVPLYNLAAKLNQVEEDEKNASSDQSAGS